MRSSGILLLTIVIFLSSLSSPVSADENIQIKGWSRMVPIIQDAAVDFINAHPNVNITVSEAENFQAIQELYDGTIDIALSRNTTDIRRQDTTIDYSKLYRYPIGRTAVVIIINQANPISRLSSLEIQRIYKGEITNWKEVGGADLPILTVGYYYYNIFSGKSSGARQIFFKSIMNMPDSTLQANKETDSEKELVKIVGENSNAIAYTYYRGISPEDTYLEYPIKTLALNMDGVSVYPSVSSINDGLYPVSENLNIYTIGNPQGVVKDFIDFVLSPAGQIHVRDNGQIPILNTYLNEEVQGPITITQPGYYWLNNDILNPVDIIQLTNNQTVVINIVSDDVIFDGMGHTISGGDKPYSTAIRTGYYSNRSYTGIVIKNVTLTKWYFGISAYRTLNSQIYGVDAKENNNAISILASKNISIFNNTLSKNRNYNIYCQWFERLNTSSNSIDGGGMGIYLVSGDIPCHGDPVCHILWKIKYPGSISYSEGFSGSNNIISLNTIRNSDRGIFLSYVDNTAITNNTIVNNSYGIYSFNSGSNVSFNNNLYLNNKQNIVYFNSPKPIFAIIFSIVLIILQSGSTFIGDFYKELFLKQVEEAGDNIKKSRANLLMKIEKWRIYLSNRVDNIKRSFERFFHIFQNSFVISAIGVGVLGISFEYAHTLQLNILMFLIFGLFGGLVLVFHELIHYYFARKFGFNVIFRIWWLGIFLTISTSYLFKSVFGQPLLSKIHGDITQKEKQLATINIAGPLGGLVLSILIFICIYMFGGNLAEYALIGFEISLVFTLISLMPAMQMDGYYIYKWKKSVWAMIFVPLFIIYAYYFIYIPQIAPLLA